VHGVGLRQIVIISHHEPVEIDGDEPAAVRERAEPERREGAGEHRERRRHRERRPAWPEDSRGQDSRDQPDDRTDDGRRARLPR